LTKAKSAASVPPSVTLAICRGAAPLLVTVTVCAALVVSGAVLKLSDAGLSVIVGAIPVPLSVMTWLPAESLSVIVDDTAPVAVGPNVTGRTQNPPFASRVVCALQFPSPGTMVKPSGFVPAGPLGGGFSVTLVIVTVWVVDVFVTVVVIAPLVVLIS